MSPSVWLWCLLLRDPKIQTRVTVRAVLVTLLIALPLCALMVVLAHRAANADLEKRIAREGRSVAAVIRAGRLQSTLITGDDTTMIQVVDAARRVVADSPAMLGRAAVNFPEPAEDDRRDGIQCGIDAPGDGCHLVVAYRVGEDADRLVVYALAPEAGWVPHFWLSVTLLLSGPLLAALIGLGVWRSAGRTLEPVAAIRRDLDEITATDLERRVPLPARRDEIYQMAASVNATLDRLERAVARQRAFVSDVSHELRSPLTGLRMELELALSDPNSPDVRDTLAAVLRNTDRLQAIMDDLLALARIESDHRPPVELVDLHELADQEVLRRPRRTRVTVEADGRVMVRGGRVELARVLTNLIDNADRHARSGVVVRVLNAGDLAVVEVVDDGTGVAPEDRERIFERFTRLAEGRHRDAGGTGLGLAISKDIAEAHHGSLSICDRRDGEQGARFVLRLPRSPD